MSIFGKLMTIDRRFIYIVLAIAMLWPMFQPIGFPVPLEPPAVALYEYMAALPEGSPVIFSADCTISGRTELKPMWEVLLDLSLQKGHRLLIMAFWADGAELAQSWSEQILERHQALYGIDYLVLGYIPSYAAFLDAARTDFPAACNGGTDYQGSALELFPLMQGIEISSDIKAVVSFGTGDPGYMHWIQYWYAMGAVEAVLGCQVAVNYPGIFPQPYSSGGLKGVAGGLSGAATLESCHGILGTGYGASDTQSLGHLAILFFVLLGNVGYLRARLRGELREPVASTKSRWKRLTYDEKA